MITNISYGTNLMKKEVISNAKWIIICKFAQSILQLVLGMITARYLGPENYGLINYAKSTVAIVVPFAQLGLSATLVQELIDAPEKEGEIMGTSLFISILSSFAGIIVVGLGVSILNSGERQTLLVCILFSFSLFFQALELLQYWFHSKLQSKYPSIMMVFAYVIVSSYKIFLLVTRKSVYWFVLAYSIEYAIVGLGLFFIYKRSTSYKLSVSLEQAKKLVDKSKYYILSALMITVFQNTDHIMLKIMSGDAENGFYSAAITCTAVMQFVYSAIIDSFRPVILSEKKSESENYRLTISKLYCIISTLSVLQSIAFFCGAKYIVWILYGSSYMEAVPVLRILTWYLAFSFMGTIRDVWILAENKQKILWKINLYGALSNIILNMMFIPRYGAVGAAFASMLTQVFANFILGFIYKPLRDNNKILIEGLKPKFVIENLFNSSMYKF